MAPILATILATVFLFAMVAVSAAASSSETMKSEASVPLSLHRRLVAGLKGKWTTLWEFPVQRQNTLLDAESASGVGEDADFRKHLKHYGFDIAKINGSLYWSRTHRNATISKPTNNDSTILFGERKGDDTLTWAMVRPDHSVIDRVTAFEVDDGSLSADDEAPTPDFYFPFLDSQILSSYMAFDGLYKAQPEGAADIHASRSSYLDLAHNAYIKAGLKKATALMKRLNGDADSSSGDTTGDSQQKDIVSKEKTGSDESTLSKAAARPAVVAPSYGYVLCDLSEAIVPTRPHRSPEGEQFTRTRRVIPSTNDAHHGQQIAKSQYLTRTAVYQGHIFELKTPSDLKISAEDAYTRYCLKDSKTPSSTTPLTITTVGGATSNNAIVIPTFAKNASLFGKGNKEDYWDLDSVVFEFGLLPHEKTEPLSKASSDDEVQTREVQEVLASATKTQLDSLLSASPAFADHPLVSSKTEPKDISSQLKHRITFRRLYRADDSSLFGAFADLWGAYNRTVFVALGFIFFRFYVGYRYGAKKIANTRKVLVAEDEKLKPVSNNKK